MYVRALAGDVWRSAPLHSPVAEVVLEKMLVKSLEDGVWSVNRQAVLVSPGLVVSFREAQDARFFLEQPHRAAPVIVEAGELVAFWEDADALHFVSQGLAERVSEDEAKSLAQARDGGGTNADNVLDLPKPSKGGKRAGTHR
jgi:hypothetical protein